jgi:uncharacterized protein (DUF1800 family)
MTPDAHIASAFNRFGLGARPGDLDRSIDPRGSLLRQPVTASAAPALFDELPPSTSYLHREAVARDERRRAKQQDDTTAAPGMGNGLRSLVRAELEARYRYAVATPDGFAERLVRFWSNHFAVSLDKRPASLYAAPMEREAIRPRIGGRFSDLLIAVEQHPAMLRYLDNVRSIGADSRIAQRQQSKRRLGLNENLAREILELHTLGVDGGYSQTDVTELARALTGWGTPLPRELLETAPVNAFVFRPNAHEGGARTVLGRRYADAGIDQARAVLTELAMHPATARHVSTKLARHFVSDEPPAALIDRMARAWLRSGGNLPDVYRALVESDEAWAPDARKFKSPDDFVVSALRALDATLPVVRLQPVLTQLGEPTFTPRSPAGFPDTTAAWSGGDALFKRIQAAQRLAQLAQSPDPLAVARTALGDGLDASTAATLRRAESARSGLALLFGSPAFQWRA